MKMPSKFPKLNSLTLVILVLIFSAIAGRAQEVIRLYEGTAPGSEDWSHEEIVYTFPATGEKMIRNVVDPTLAVFRPAASVATGTAVIVCPGGGYFCLAYEKEGTEVARWLAQRGVTAFVLKYRTTITPPAPDEFEEFQASFGERIRALRESEDATPSLSWDLGGEDGIRAIEWVRKRSGEFQIDPQKVGIMGFSAGAGVTMYTILNSTPEKRPDFGAPIYGGGLNDRKVPDDAPPIFIACAADDWIASGAPDLYKAWREAGASAELHIYSQGGHGFGILQRNLPVDTWIERYHEWLKTTGF